MKKAKGKGNTGTEQPDRNTKGRSLMTGLFLVRQAWRVARKRRSEELTALLERWKQELKAIRLRADAVVHRLPDLLIGTPVVTVRRVADALAIFFPAATNALSLLEEKGILKQPKNSCETEYSWQTR